MLLEAMISKEAGTVSNPRRLELIGGSFLKFASTVWTFYNPPKDERLDAFVRARDQGICNEKLVTMCKKIGLHKYICPTLFRPGKHFDFPLLGPNPKKV